MLHFDYIEFVHRFYDSGRVKLGGLDYFVEHLVANGSNVLMVESPLYPKLNNEISATLVTNDGKEKLFTLKIPFTNNLVVWFVGLLADFYVVIRYQAFGKIFLTSDPLTSFPAVILRQLHLAKYHYYHCTDYSQIRFKNNLLNRLYHFLMTLSVEKADLVGAVSKRIYDELKKYKYKNLIYIPNSPSFNKYEKYRLPIDNRNKAMLVLTCLGISHRYKIVETLTLFNQLWLKHQHLKLTIIGSPDIDKDYNQKVMALLYTLPCKTHVIFTGYVSREENCAIIGASYIGLSFYDEVDSYSRYADSLKIREYAAIGIPCISDLVTSTAEEMQTHGAGIAVAAIADAQSAIEKIFADPLFYEDLSKKALSWAAELDKDKILNEIQNKYFTHVK
jgi:glycosyltransferase involved in cell wall biosynthesis